MAQNNDLITLADLQALGLDTDDETVAATASKWITFVSNQLLLIAANNGVNLTQNVKLDEQVGGYFAESVKMVVCNAVLRANATNIEAPDATQYSQAATPYSESFSWNPATREAYFKHKELELLGLENISGKSQLTVLRGVRG